jgi:hypothetical protein
LPPVADRAFAERLRHKARRNASCLQAAARGLRAAQRRLGDMNTATSGLSTYTSRGQRADVGTQTGMMAKRL